MTTYSVFYNTTMYYEVIVEADSPEQAEQLVREGMGDHEEYDIESTITSTREMN